MQQVKDRLRLFVLPPYSPEINRDELVWNDVKNHGVARALIRAPQRFASRSEFKVATAAKKSRKARAFFQMETTRYAAA